MPSRCFWLQVCSALFALVILDVFLELHVTELLDDGRVFSPLSAAFFGLFFGVEALPIHDYGDVDIHTLIDSSEQQQQQQPWPFWLKIATKQVALCRPWLTVVNVSSSFRLSRNEVMTHRSCRGLLCASTCSSCRRIHCASTRSFLSWNTPAVPFVEYIAPAPAIPVGENIAPAPGCSCRGVHRAGSSSSCHEVHRAGSSCSVSWNTLRQHQQFTLPLHLSWKTFRQHLSPLQLQSWSTSRQFRLQRQLCHRHLQHVFNLVKVRIEFPRKFPP